MKDNVIDTFTAMDHDTYGKVFVFLLPTVGSSPFTYMQHIQ